MDDFEKYLDEFIARHEEKLNCLKLVDLADEWDVEQGQREVIGLKTFCNPYRRARE